VPIRGFGVKLVLLLVAGAIVRLLLIALTPGEFYDTSAISRVGQAFLTSPLHIYHLDIHPGSYQGSPTYSWPYPPAFVPVAGLLRWVSDHLGASVNRLDRGLIAAVDLAVAYLVQWALGWWGRSERERLQGAALITLGPVFVAIAGVHGQIDALAWLPVVGAVALWEGRPEGPRALVCGVLIGLGIAIKTTPGLGLLALGASARDRRELAVLTTSAAAVVIGCLAPFVAAAPHGISALFSYRGFAGRAGLTVLLQPRLAIHQLTGPNIVYDTTTAFLLDHAGVILVVTLSLVTVRIRTCRLCAAPAIVALLLAFYVVSPAVLPQYWLWIVPFLILADRRRAALVYQLALLPLLVATYAFLQEPNQPLRHLSANLVLYGYVPLLWIVTVAMAVALAVSIGPRRVTPAH